MRVPLSGTSVTLGSVSQSPSTGETEADLVRSKISSMFAGLNFAEREPAASSKAAAKVAMKAGPLQMQVPEKELKALIARLSEKCEQQFMTILHGQSPPIHSFGAPGSDASAASCTELEGSLCAMDAHVSQKKAMQSREMSSVTSVHGNGCLPRKCLTSTDLEALAGFFQTKAKEALAGVGTEVKLSVNCTKVGGTVAVAGSVVKGIDPEITHVKSGGIGLQGRLVALVALLAVFCFVL